MSQGARKGSGFRAKGFVQGLEFRVLVQGSGRRAKSVIGFGLWGKAFGVYLGGVPGVVASAGEI